MNIPLLEPRVTSLESMMADLIATVDNTSRIVAQLSLEMREFKEESLRNRENFREEMREFKEESLRNRENFREEMRDFKEEMKEFKDEMKEFKDEMKEFKDEMKEFKDEMKEFREESRRRSADADARLDRHIADNRLMIRDMNRKWGEIANKQGRMTEDLVAPSVGRILQEIVGAPCDSQDQEAIRVKRRHCITRERKEFDALAECREYLLINETKSSLNVQDVNDFMEAMKEIRNYFPEYSSKRIIGSLAALYADPSLVKYASAKGIVILAVGDELMDIQNGPEFRPAEF